MAPVHNIVQVYCTHISEPWVQGEFDRLMSLLSPKMQQSVLMEKGWEEQYGNLARKLLLLHGLKKAEVEMKNPLEHIQHTTTGKPYIPEAPHFSAANDGAVAVCALSRTSVLGIDVERIKPTNLSDFREKLTFLEWREIYSDIIPLRRFYEIWTIKESVIKADGEAGKSKIKDIFVQPDVAFCNAKYWYINPVELDCYGYLSFMVCSAPHAEIEIVNVDLLQAFPA